jgi:hypothetical protein
MTVQKADHGLACAIAPHAGVLVFDDLEPGMLIHRGDETHHTPLNRLCRRSVGDGDLALPGQGLRHVLSGQ